MSRLTWLIWLLLPVGMWGVIYVANLPPDNLYQPYNVTCESDGWTHFVSNKDVPINGSEVNLYTASLLHREVCTPGVLSLTARGTSVRGEYPLMVITLNDQALLSARVSRERQYQVRVPGRGLLSIAFTNDAVWPETGTATEDRNLFISKIRFAPN